MDRPHPFVREAGSGPGIVCLHANASSSTEWRALMSLLSDRFHVLAPDLSGAGQSPVWPADRPTSLRDEVAFLEPVLERAGNPHVLVGHSYGAAVALIAAVARPNRIRALAVYEPVLFSLVEAAHPPPNDADGIRAVLAASVRAVDAGDPGRAAESFIDFWMGSGAWARMPPSRHAPIAASIVNIGTWTRALFSEPTPLSAFSALDVPVLFMMGKESRADARAVGRLLVGALPGAQVMEFAGVGHMGPVTHPDVVNTAIARFLDAR